MVKGLAADIADQMGIRLSGVSVVEGRRVGCLDMSLLHLAADDRLVSALVHKSELEDLQNGSGCERLEVKIQTALSRLKLLLEP